MGEFGLIILRAGINNVYDRAGQSKPAVSSALVIKFTIVKKFIFSS
ncbi:MULTISPECIES: hypothetical protein [Priestia]